VRSAVGIDLDVQDDCSLDAGPLGFRCVLWCASDNYRRSLGPEVGLRIEHQTGQKEAKRDLPHEQIVHPTAGSGRKKAFAERWIRTGLGSGIPPVIATFRALIEEYARRHRGELSTRPT
jgi:hypothetical protein